MANTSDADRTPDFAQVPPRPITSEAGQTRFILHEIRDIQGRISGLAESQAKAYVKLDQLTEVACGVRQMNDSLAEMKVNTRSDHRFVLKIFGSGFVLICTFVIGGFLWLSDRFENSSLRVSDKIENLNVRSQRVDTKLEDLLARIPPIQNPVPTKR